MESILNNLCKIRELRVVSRPQSKGLRIAYNIPDVADEQQLVMCSRAVSRDTVTISG